MRFDLTDDQHDIKSVARGSLDERAPIATVRDAAERGGGDPNLWREIAALGWPGIAVAEEHGGQGFDTVTLAVILEGAGYACLSTPLASTATVAAVLQACGSDEQRERWLPPLAAGEVTAGLGLPDLVVDGPDAAVVLIIDDGPRLIVDPDVEAVSAIDPTRPADVALLGGLGGHRRALGRMVAGVDGVVGQRAR
ncbi:MAG: acyl-CoA dehydrogenase family protein [Solirubrobacteraceae bacterium]